MLCSLGSMVIIASAGLRTRCICLPIGAGRYQRNGRGLPQKSKTPFLIPAEITFWWPQNLGKGWMPKATAIIYPPRVQADQTNLLMHAALKLKVLINLHLGKRVPNDEDIIFSSACSRTPRQCPNRYAFRAGREVSIEQIRPL